MIIDLPFKVSSNKFYAGMHFTERAKIKDAFLWAVKAKRHSLPIVKNYPVDINFEFTFKSRLLDWVNTSIMAKMIEDGLVFCNVLHDDSKKYVRSGKLSCIKGKTDQVRISINGSN